MTLDDFWAIIAASRVRGMEDNAQQLANLRSHLQSLEPNELLSCYHYFRTMENAAYNHDLWGVAYIINGGCSDDGFYYFICALVAEGRERFEKSVADPDSMAEWCEGIFAFGGIDSLIINVFQEKTRQSFNNEYTKLYPNKIDLVLTGDEWDEDDLPARFPKTWAKFDE